MNTTKILKSYRGKALKSQGEMASIFNVSRQTYVNYENNPLQCPTDLLFRIASVLEVNKNEFFNALEQDYKSYKLEQ